MVLGISGRKSQDSSIKVDIELKSEDEDLYYEPAAPSSDQGSEIPLYATPNKVIPNRSNGDIKVALDREVRYGKAIMMGDIAELKQILHQYKHDEPFLLRDIDTHKIVSGNNNADKIEYHDLPKRVSPLELALLFDQEPVFDLLVETGKNNCKKFTNYLQQIPFENPGLVMTNLIESNPCLMLDCLHKRLSHDQGNNGGDEDREAINIDLAPLCLSDQNLIMNESEILTKIVNSHQEELLRHPVIEVFRELKWKQVRSWFHFWILFHLILAIVGTCTTLDRGLAKTDRHILATINWVYLAMILVDLVQLFLSVIILFSKRKISRQAYLEQGLNNVWRLVVLCLALVWIFRDHIPNSSKSRTDLACWMIFVMWTNLLVQIRYHPTMGLYILLLSRVLQKTLIFLILTLPITIASIFVYNQMLPLDISDGFKKSMITVMSMAHGNTEQILMRETSHLPMTFEVLLVIYFIVVSICIATILISIAWHETRELFAIKKDFRRGQMILDIYHFESLMFWVQGVLSKFCPKLKKHLNFKVVKNKGNNVYKLNSMPSKENNLITGFFNPNKKTNLDLAYPSENWKSKSTGIKMDPNTWNIANAIIMEQQDLTPENDYNRSTGGADYSSLYWNNSEATENEYEVVDDGKSSFRGLRDSVLKELKRDLTKLMRLDSSVSSSSSEKCINVRPGLASGVIILQAGSRGQRLLV